MRPLSIWEQFPEAVEILKAGYAASDSATMIALKLSGLFHVNMTRNAVIGKIHRLGLSSKFPKEHQGAQTRAYSRTQRKPRRRDPGLATGGLATDLAPETALNPVGIFDLKEHHCRWPVNGSGCQIMFCGDPAVERMSYCQHHCDMAFATPAQLRADKAAWARRNSNKDPSSFVFGSKVS